MVNFLAIVNPTVSPLEMPLFVNGGDGPPSHRLTARLPWFARFLAKIGACSLEYMTWVAAGGGPALGTSIPKQTRDEHPGPVRVRQLIQPGGCARSSCQNAAHARDHRQPTTKCLHTHSSQSLITELPHSG